MTRPHRAPVAALLVAAAGFVLIPLLAFVLLFSRTGSEQCSPSQHDVMMAADAEAALSLNAAQLRNVATVIEVGNKLGIPRQGIVVALAVASQESRFLNYANDGVGGDLAPDQQGIQASLLMPHEAVGTDHGSLGIFQQQWPWWGTMTELMTPANAAEKFYLALLEVPDWQRLPVTVAGQAVQRSAYPSAYADDAALAEALLAEANPSTGTVVPAIRAAGTTCAPGTDSGAVVFPLPAGSGYVDQANWGNGGTHWSRRHTGTDLSVGCGTPVLAAHAGTIEIRTDQPWSGPWLVEVTTGPGQLTTWYAHMQAVTVRDGSRVASGQQIGEVGSEGNSTGCHLHFEVHPSSGDIYDDSVDPSAWLERNITRGREANDVAAFATDKEFTVATLNVLGHSHTRANGNKPGWPGSGIRMRWTVQILRKYAVDVVGLQEFQKPQRQRMLTRAGNRYRIFSPRGDPQDSIAWRDDRFSLVAADTFKIPYFVRQRPMPVVQLRDRTTGEDTVFVSVHNPASVRRFPNQAPRRAEAVRRELAVVRSLSERGHTVVLMGDFNEKEVVFCKVTASGLLRASAGGSHDAACRPPSQPRIDWIFATKDLTFTGHRATREGLIARTTDHHLIVAQARR